MLQVPNHQWAGIVIYLIAMTGISLLVIELSSVVADQAAVLALPYLDHSPPKLSLIEQRRIDATLAIQPLPEAATRRVAALEAPSLPANILAARLDLAEMNDLPASPARLASAADGSLEPTSHPFSIAVRVQSYETTGGSAQGSKLQAVRSNAKYAAVTASDVFNRSFGVLSLAGD